MESSASIEAIKLCKSYDGTAALEDLTLQVRSGEIFGLLGPNGAGKTTTLRIFITTLHPTSGHAFVLGHDVMKSADRVRQLIGYVPQERAIDRFLTGREHLHLLAALYHLSKADALARVNTLLTLVDLTDKADSPAKTYSGGMKRKLDIACGLIPNPKVLFLDEPTLGLDVQSRLRIWEYIRLLKAEGRTVVMTTNYLDEADQLCDRLAILDKGHMKALGSPGDLKASLGGDLVSLTIGEGDAHRVDPLAAALRGLPSVRSIRTVASALDIRVESSEKALPAILEMTNRLAYRLESVKYTRPRLDDVFVACTGRPLQEDDTVMPANGQR